MAVYQGTRIRTSAIPMARGPSPRGAPGAFRRARSGPPLDRACPGRDPHRVRAEPRLPDADPPVGGHEAADRQRADRSHDAAAGAAVAARRPSRSGARSPRSSSGHSSRGSTGSAARSAFRRGRRTMLGRTDRRLRILVLLVAFAVFAMAAVARLGYWQVARGSDLQNQASAQTVRSAEQPAIRGNIYDRQRRRAGDDRVPRHAGRSTPSSLPKPIERPSSTFWHRSCTWAQAHSARSSRN